MHMKRDKNQFVDVLATLKFMAKMNYWIRVQPMCIEIKNLIAHYCLVEEEVEGKPWYHDIKHFNLYQ